MTNETSITDVNLHRGSVLLDICAVALIAIVGVTFMPKKVEEEDSPSEIYQDVYERALQRTDDPGYATRKAISATIEQTIAQATEGKDALSAKRIEEYLRSKFARVTSQEEDQPIKVPASLPEPKYTVSDPFRDPLDPWKDIAFTDGTSVYGKILDPSGSLNDDIRMLKSITQEDWNANVDTRPVLTEAVSQILAGVSSQEATDKYAAVSAAFRLSDEEYAGASNEQRARNISLRKQAADEAARQIEAASTAEFNARRQQQRQVDEARKTQVAKANSAAITAKSEAVLAAVGTTWEAQHTAEQTALLTTGRYETTGYSARLVTKADGSVVKVTTGTPPAAAVQVGASTRTATSKDAASSQRVPSALTSESSGKQGSSGKTTTATTSKVSSSTSAAKIFADVTGLSTARSILKIIGR